MFLKGPAALVDFIFEEKRNVIVLCAGWKNKFNLEDTVFAGALVEKVLKNPNFTTICDSTHASMDLWNIARENIMGYIEKAAQRHRLKKNRLDDVLEYCHTMDLTHCIPVLEDYYLTELNFLKQ